eukprot:tig00021339_g20383.t1
MAFHLPGFITFCDPNAKGKCMIFWIFLGIIFLCNVILAGTEITRAKDAGASQEKVALIGTLTAANCAGLLLALVSVAGSAMGGKKVAAAQDFYGGYGQDYYY